MYLAVTDAKNFSVTFNDSHESQFVGPSPLSVLISDTSVRLGSCLMPPEVVNVLQPSTAQITHSATIVDLTTVASNETITFSGDVTTREYLTTLPTLSINHVSFLMENVTIKLDQPYASCQSGIAVATNKQLKFKLLPGPNTLKVLYHYVDPTGQNGTFYDISSIHDANYHTVRPVLDILGDWFIRVEISNGVSTRFSVDYWVRYRASM